MLVAVGGDRRASSAERLESLTDLVSTDWAPVEGSRALVATDVVTARNQGTVDLGIHAYLAGRRQGQRFTAKTACTHAKVTQEDRSASIYQQSNLVELSMVKSKSAWHPLHDFMTWSGNKRQRRNEHCIGKARQGKARQGKARKQTAR